PALLPDDDADPVVDRVSLLAAPGAEPQRCQSNLHRAELSHVAASGRSELTNDAGSWKHVFVRVPALGPDPAPIRRQGAAVDDRALDAPASGLGVDAEIGQREQLRRRLDDELDEVGRPFT